MLDHWKAFPSSNRTQIYHQLMNLNMKVKFLTNLPVNLYQDRNQIQIRLQLILTNQSFNNINKNSLALETRYFIRLICNCCPFFQCHIASLRMSQSQGYFGPLRENYKVINFSYAIFFFHQVALIFNFLCTLYRITISWGHKLNFIKAFVFKSLMNSEILLICF